MEVYLDKLGDPGEDQSGDRQAERQDLEDIGLSVHNKSIEYMESPCHWHMVKGILEVHRSTPHWLDSYGNNLRNMFRFESRNNQGGVQEGEINELI